MRFEDGKGGRQGPNQVEHLAKILKKYQFVYQPAQIQTSNLPKRVEEGVAFFSKYPIIDHDFLLLTRYVPVILYNLHFANFFLQALKVRESQPRRR